MTTNKEVIDNLQRYFLKQDMKVITRALANAMIDYYRIAHRSTLPEDELTRLVYRIKKNADQLQKFVKSGFKDGEGLSLMDVSKE